MKKLLFWGAALLLAACSTPDYRDASLPPATRAKALLAQMTLEEKVGQMCQYVGPCYVPPGEGSAHGNVDATDENLGHPDMAEKIREGKVGSFLHVLSGEEAAGLQRIASESRLGIPLLLGVDAIHGNALHEGCTIYPTNINMASTFNPAMMEQIGAETAQEMRRTGMYWTFAPNLDVARDARWGRMGETYGEDPLLVSEMGKHLIWGLQGRDGVYGEDHVLACAKHLIAGGEPFGGINAAPMDLSERKLREVFLPPFVAAVKDVLEKTPPELVGDVYSDGILLTGALAKITGFAQLIADYTDVKVTVADNPEDCVILGCGEAIQYIGEVEKTAKVDINPLMAAY